MYSINNIKKKFKKNKIDGIELVNLDGFILSNKGLKINNQVIRNIKVIDNDIAHSLVHDKVFYKYNKLIVKLTDLITSDDDSGNDIREALNQIERFRLEIKNKYRNYLKKVELEKMSKELSTLKKAAEIRYLEFNDYFNELTSGKSR